MSQIQPAGDACGHSGGVVRPALLSRSSSAAIAASACLLPPLMSLGANPAPTNPRILAWYALLKKPAFKPPDVVIPVAWSAIEACLSFAGYRLLRRPPTALRNRALTTWAFNVFMIGGWSRLFFRKRSLGLSTVAAATMVATGVTYVVQARPVDRQAAAAGLPFVGWVAFATVLTAAIWRLNRRSRQESRQ